MKDLAEILRDELRRSEDYRYAYDEEFANTFMATQIKVLRESRDPSLTQKQLAEKAGMKQSRISELENIAYSSWSISTLRRLARALGVRLVFKFESWGDLLTEVATFRREVLEVPRFELDPAFEDAAVPAPAAQPFFAETDAEISTLLMSQEESEETPLGGRRPNRAQGYSGMEERSNRPNHLQGVA